MSYCAEIGQFLSRELSSVIFYAGVMKFQFCYISFVTYPIRNNLTRVTSDLFAVI